MLDWAMSDWMMFEMLDWMMLEMLDWLMLEMLDWMCSRCLIDWCSRCLIECVRGAWLNDVRDAWLSDARGAWAMSDWMMSRVIDWMMLGRMLTECWTERALLADLTTENVVGRDLDRLAKNLWARWLDYRKRDRARFLTRIKAANQLKNVFKK